MNPLMGAYRGPNYGGNYFSAAGGNYSSGPGIYSQIWLSQAQKSKSRFVFIIICDLE